MMLDVGDALKNPGQRYPFSLEFAYEPMDMLGDTITFDNVVVSGEYFGAGETVNVSGIISALARTRCARCLCSVEQPMRAELSEVFVKQAQVSEDSEAHTMDGYTVELEPLVKQALILETPMRFLCREDCKGLCSACGKDLNLGACECGASSAKPNPFQALSSLVNDLDDEEV